MTKQEILLAEVLKSRQEYVTDGYSMSIGEIVSNYKEGEIIINPEFQRKFRWSPQLRSRLIESILIGFHYLPFLFIKLKKENGKSLMVFKEYQQY
ncbi:MAG: DUF262 domain-containing protein [Bacteroidales bacterium]|nr:DUF262 domain-containing protein [Bacteroidales bacterium]